MDSSFVNYDGRSVHDMIEILQAASGDPEAIARLQASINAVDAKFGPVNTELARLEDDKQDVGDYVKYSNVPGYSSFNFTQGAYVAHMKRNNNQYSNGISIMGVDTEPDTDGVTREWLRWEKNSSKLQGYTYKNNAWETVNVWTADQEYTQFVEGEYMNFQLYRRNNIVQVTYMSSLKQDIPIGSGSQNDTLLTTLPIGYRPLNNYGCAFADNLGSNFFMLLITGNGEVRVRTPTLLPANRTLVINAIFIPTSALPTT